MQGVAVRFRIYRNRLDPQLAAAGPEAPLLEIRAARRDELDQVAVVRSEAFSLPREHWPPLDRVSDPELEGMLTPEEVADVVLFTVTRPRGMRILTTTFRPMNEGSWG